MTKKCLMPLYGLPDISAWRLRSILGVMLLSCCVGGVLAPVFAQSPNRPQALAPTYWKQRLFYIPYQANQHGKLFGTIEKVQLLLSRTGANDWKTLEEAESHVQGFSYHAPEDGEYWFALRHLDRRGQAWPTTAVQPQMRLVVDTLVPELSLSGSIDARGEIVIRYEARDANLKPESLLVEVLTTGAAVPGDRWSPLPLEAPDITQPDRLLGRIRWRAPADALKVELRASIVDKAGQRAFAETGVKTDGAQRGARDVGLPVGPTLRSPTAQIDTASISSGSSRQLPARNWPASNRLPEARQPAELGVQDQPPSANPYTIANQAGPDRTSANLLGAGIARSNRSTDASRSAESLRITPLSPETGPPLLTGSPGPVALTSPATDPLKKSQLETLPFVGGENEREHDWAPARNEEDQSCRRVNSRTFDIEYELQLVGPWGVSKVELWGTDDQGRSWESFGVDPDNRSPFRVTVPRAGTFGFRMLVDGANSVGAAPPQAGDEPELTVSVDLKPPTAEIVAADLGQGNLADHLMVRWTATDSNLEHRPIALFYSSYPNGPWSTIASGLENTGSYTWRIERHVPGRFYLRLEARDKAGNLATFQAPSPIALARPQPTGRLRRVRPIDSDARP